MATKNQMFRDVFSVMWNGHPCLEGLWLVWFILETHFCLEKKQQHIFVPSGDEICDVPWWKKNKTPPVPTFNGVKSGLSWRSLCCDCRLLVVSTFNPSEKCDVRQIGSRNPTGVGVKLSRKGAHLPLWNRWQHVIPKTRKLDVFCNRKIIGNST